MDHLRKRRDFLAAAKAERAGATSFLMQGRDRGDAGTVRVGFTVTKKTGNSVVRNRIRRRLREAVRRVLPETGRAGFDYVLVAREAALRTPFETLVREIERSVRKVNTPKVQGAKVQGPKVQGGKVHGGKVHDPKTDAPKTDAPKTGASKADAPQPDAPKSNAPHGVRKAEGRPEHPASTGGAGAAAGAITPPSDDIKPTPADGGLPA
ncbi:ribonuclease P protein component [Xanthobacter autotrophicus]|uniref:ribonuclease P protein component n=1 Tax=Xanthobacter autotrophicus TaxID=280 RepID=UPI0024A73FB8|nr:ribonuclease P protein component [Xanthobacter autotrophicus]MDI4658667.1 ribonuclease P protein component [Xanthobacter autotrophicus]